MSRAPDDILDDYENEIRGQVSDLLDWLEDKGLTMPRSFIVAVSAAYIIGMIFEQGHKERARQAVIDVLDGINFRE
jgi:hypothetical protein